MKSKNLKRKYANINQRINLKLEHRKLNENFLNEKLSRKIVKCGRGKKTNTFTLIKRAFNESNEKKNQRFFFIVVVVLKRQK